MRTSIFASVMATMLFPIMSPAHDNKPMSEVLLSSKTTRLNQQIIYPQGQAEITVVMLTMQPGQVTAWHYHPVPVYGNVIEGEITVEYAGNGFKTYRKGDNILEAIGTHHIGRNNGSKPVKLLVIFMGAEGVENSINVLQ